MSKPRVSGGCIVRDMPNGLETLYTCPNCDKVKWDKNPGNIHWMWCDCPLPAGGPMPRLKALEVETE